MQTPIVENISTRRRKNEIDDSFAQNCPPIALAKTPFPHLLWPQFKPTIRFHIPFSPLSFFPSSLTILVCLVGAGGHRGHPLHDGSGHRRSMRIYGSGPCNGFQFSSVPNLRSTALLTFRFVSAPGAEACVHALRHQLLRPDRVPHVDRHDAVLAKLEQIEGGALAL